MVWNGKVYTPDIVGVIRQVAFSSSLVHYRNENPNEKGNKRTECADSGRKASQIGPEV